MRARPLCLSLLLLAACAPKDGGPGDSAPDDSAPDDSASGDTAGADDTGVTGDTGDTDTDTDADTDSDTDADTDSDTDTDTDSDTDTDTDSGGGRVDADGDGIVAGRDCDDADPTVYPGAADPPCDSIDQDCDGADASGGLLTPASGTPEDVTATLLAASSSAPAALTVADSTLTLCHGDWYAHLVLYGDATVIADDVTLRSTDADYALRVTSGVGTVSGVRFEGGSVGVVADEGASVVMSDCQLVDNDTALYAYSAASFDLTDVDVDAPRSAGTSIYSSTFTMRGGSVTNAVSSYYAPFTFFGSVVAIEGTTFADNSAVAGGAIDVSNSALTLVDVRFERNHAETGGAVRTEYTSSLSSTNSVWTGNTATTGGALYVAGGGALTLDGDTFDGNSAVNYGGAAYVVGAELVATDVTFTGNVASTDGAALYLGVNATVTNGAFDGNSGAGSTVGLAGYPAYVQSGGSYARNTSTGAGALFALGCYQSLTLTGVTLGVGADANSPDGLLDASGDLFGGSTLDLSCPTGECAGGATNRCG